MLPLALPLVPLSDCFFHDPSVWMLLTLFAYEGMLGPLPEDPLLDPPPTLMAIFAEHPAPFVPHDFTCSVCAPSPADAEAFSLVPFTTSWFPPLSSE
jgi:hypothetical protein